MSVPILKDIVRQHAEQAAFLWTVYDRALLYPDENPDMDADRLARVVERLEAHLDGLKIAGPDGLRIAEEQLAEHRDAGQLFVVRMLQPGAEGITIDGLDLDRVREYISQSLLRHEI
ncbi:hypothetical protein SLH49_01335 [Cognatiyoonia sp. IB215446]|uniref:hypothetical protein n=1 Tax=Cognatiyoonia sp. IB215446 TaxID=3097355 RepID=UPI002A0C0950|nr:hypothetical protein [Cognatiyoonia sp. IB215446]MDX8346614.1 hypothetical protein [Cognatiyoonia sp. IB215446]